MYSTASSMKQKVRWWSIEYTTSSSPSAESWIRCSSWGTTWASPMRGP